ncbi:MAG: hypothetical protein QW035_03290 [Candidatus Anstonellales archaeon]
MNRFLAFFIIGIVLAPPLMAQSLGSLPVTQIRCISNDLNGLRGEDLRESFRFCTIPGIECGECREENGASSASAGGIKVFTCPVTAKNLKLAYRCWERGCIVSIGGSNFFMATDEQGLMQKCLETFGSCECLENECIVSSEMLTLPAVCTENGCAIWQTLIPFCHNAPIANNTSISLRGLLTGSYERNGFAGGWQGNLEVEDDGRLMLPFGGGFQLLVDSNSMFEITPEKLRFRTMLGHGGFSFEADVDVIEEVDGQTFLKLKNIRMLIEDVSPRNGVVIDIEAKADTLKKELTFEFGNSDEFPEEEGEGRKLAEFKVGNGLANFDDVTIRFKVHKSIVGNGGLKVFKKFEDGHIEELIPEIEQAGNWYYITVNSNSFSIYAITTIGYANPEGTAEPKSNQEGSCLGAIAMIGAATGIGIIGKGKGQKRLQ